jgi:protein transport protein SEC31
MGMGAPGIGAPPMAPPAAPAPPSAPGRTTTAPQGTAKNVIDGLPVAWPCPTGTQQKLSTTTSTAAANMQVQAASEGPGAVIGDPLSPQDLQQCQAVFGQVLEVSSQDGNARKREDISKRLDELYNKLQYGYVGTPTSQKVMQLVRAVEQQDFVSANKIQVELSTADWDKNKNWLMGVKRLLAR